MRLTLIFCCLIGCSVASAQLSMTHSASQTVEAQASINCSNNQGHADNSYWRSFTLCDLAVDDEILVDAITFGVETSEPGGTQTTQPIEVRLYLDPTPATIGDPGTLTLLYSEIFQVPALMLSLFTATLSTPVVVPCHTTLVVEVHSPNGQAAGHSFFIGANDDGQTAPSYLSAPPCSLLQPTDLAQIGFPGMQIVLNVDYSVGTPCGACSGIPFDCHDAQFGSYRRVFEQATVFSSTPAAQILSGQPPLTDGVVVTGVANISDLDVFVDITHPFVGDLNVSLADPVGVTVTLHGNAGVNLSNLRVVYDDDGRANARPYNTPPPAPAERMVPSGPGVLADFAGGPGNGTWTLSISDGMLDPSDGTLNFWELRFIDPVVIPDNNLAGVEAVLSIDPANTDEVMDVDVRTRIVHPDRGELTVEVISPLGTSVTLAVPGTLSGSGNTTRFDDGSVTYCDGFGLAPSGPGALADFDGEIVGGDWRLRLIDGVPGQEGALMQWELMVNPVPRPFVRGDCNADGGVNISDAVCILNHLFTVFPVECRDALDTNDDGSVESTDAVFLLSLLFNGGSLPPEPFPTCGIDTTLDNEYCDMFTPCP